MTKYQPPQRGDRVQLRGRESRGVLRTIYDELQWCVVEWDPDDPGPKYVHIRELDKTVEKEPGAS